MLSDRFNTARTRRARKIMKHEGRKPRPEKTGERKYLFLLYISLFLSALAISVVMCAQKSTLYLACQEKCGLFGGRNPLDKTEVIRMNESVTDYLSGKSRTIDNVSARAQLHMRDVKDIFDGVKVAAAALLTFSIALVMRMKTAEKRSAVFVSLFPPLFSSALFLSAFLLDFETVFYRFHEIVFENDLWLLDPAEDFLIRCLPEMFFLEMAMISIGQAFLIYAFFACITFLFINKFGRRD